MRNRIIHLIEAAAASDPSVVFLTGDLGFSVVEPLVEALGDRFINMGVAEANMISVASSLAAQGFTPFAYTIAPFITVRCLEQIRNDVAYQKRPVRMIGVGAGFSYGSLGPSHHALEDAHVMAAIPDMIVCNPANVAELDRLFAAVATERRPVYFRIARETGNAEAAPILPLDSFAYVARQGRDVALVTSGSTLTECLAAAGWLKGRGVSARVISVPVLQPFPAKALGSLLGDMPVLCVMEAYHGHPLAVGVMETLLANGTLYAFDNLTAPHSFAKVVGDTEALRASAGLDAIGIGTKALCLLARPEPMQLAARQ